MNWDFLGRDDSIDEIQEDIIEKVIGKPKDFELTRFENKQYPGESYETAVNYNFYFKGVNLFNNFEKNFMSKYSNFLETLPKRNIALLNRYYNEERKRNKPYDVTLLISLAMPVFVITTEKIKENDGRN
mgnify:CR=1 FL=1